MATVSAQPGNGVLTISVCPSMPFPRKSGAPGDDARGVLELEAEDVVARWRGHALGHDIRFFSLDLTNIAYTLLLQRTAPCWYRQADLVPRRTPVRAICASLKRGLNDVFCEPSQVDLPVRRMPRRPSPSAVCEGDREAHSRFLHGYLGAAEALRDLKPRRPSAAASPSPMAPRVPNSLTIAEP